MTWDYRVMKVTDPMIDEWLEIREVYYDGSGKPLAYAGDSSEIVGVTINELRDTLRLMEEALDMPILTPRDFEKSESSDV